MKTIGLLGGMSWESTAEYYRLINQRVKERLGGLHSAKIAMVSVDFAELEQLLGQGDWDGVAEVLSKIAMQIEVAGADGLMICTNTMHKIAPQIENKIGIPLLHIADATAEALVKDGIKTVGLLGTAFTMEQEFYKGRLKEKFGLNVIVPSEEDRKTVHNVIFNELCKGLTLEASKSEYLRVIESLSAKGAEAVILGCTEIGILVQQKDTSIKLIDTTVVHAQKAVSWMLEVNAQTI